MDLYFMGERILGENDGLYRPNMLINSYFVKPVNRNGKTDYKTEGYCIDGWKIVFESTSYAGTVSIKDDGIQISAHKNGYIDLDQDMETCDYLIGESMVASFIVDGQLYSCKFKFGDVANGMTVCEGVQFYSVPTRYFILRVLKGSSALVKAVKLETGTNQTLAHKEGEVWELNEIPNYAEQCLICEQYSLNTGEFIGSRHSNPNLFDNTNFHSLVNQSGKSQWVAETSTVVYTVDRWYITRGVLDIIPDVGVGLTWNGNSEYAPFSQRFNPLLDPEKLYTASFIVNDVLHTLTYRPSGGLKTSEKIDNVSIRYGKTGNYYWVGVLNYSQTRVIIKAAKFELGPVQTLAHKEGGVWILNDPPLNNALEVLKCQEYQWFSSPYQGIRIRASQYSADSIFFFIPLPVKLRKNPTLINPDNFAVMNYEIAPEKQDGFTFTVDRLTNDGVIIIANKPDHGLTDAFLYAEDIVGLDANL